MPRWLKQVVAVLLLPLCLGASQALFWVLAQGGGPLEGAGENGRFRVWTREQVWVALLAGGACWWVIYLMLPKPLWAYVMGHEVTHVLWTWLFGGRVKRFRATPRGGHVIVTRANFLIILAPYFFPIYALVVALVYGVAAWFWEGDRYRLPFLLLLGAAYAFHLTLTWHALQTEQTDVSSQGHFFSAVIIWLGNVAVLLLGLPLLLDVSFSETARELGRGTWEVVRGVLRVLGFPD